MHARFRVLDPVLADIDARDVDGILLVGDLGSHDVNWAVRRTPEGDARYLASLEALWQRVEALGKPYLWLPGNHDLPAPPGAQNVDHRVDTVAGLRVAGIGGAGPARFGFCYEWDEDDVRARDVPDCDVLLCHAPPRGTALDRTRTGEHVGSAAIRERAEAHDGVLVCGHIHEAPGAVQLGRCLCLNAGGLGKPFGQAQVGYVTWDGDWHAEHVDLLGGTRRRWSRQ